MTYFFVKLNGVSFSSSFISHNLFMFMMAQFFHHFSVDNILSLLNNRKVRKNFRIVYKSNSNLKYQKKYILVHFCSVLNSYLPDKTSIRLVFELADRWIHFELQHTEHLLLHCPEMQFYIKYFFKKHFSVKLILVGFS